MKTFQDNKNQEWQIALTYASVKRVKDLLDIDLTKAMEGDPPMFRVVQEDLLLLCNILYVVCKPQADAKGITDEQFGELLGDVQIFAASNAFYAEWVGFFRNLQRPESATMLEKQRSLMTRAYAKVNQELSSPKVDQLLEHALDQVSIDWSKLQPSSESNPTTEP